MNQVFFINDWMQKGLISTKNIDTSPNFSVIYLPFSRYYQHLVITM